MAVYASLPGLYKLLFKGWLLCLGTVGLAHAVAASEEDILEEWGNYVRWEREVGQAQACRRALYYRYWSVLKIYAEYGKVRDEELWLTLVRGRCSWEPFFPFSFLDGRGILDRGVFVRELLAPLVALKGEETVLQNIFPYLLFKAWVIERPCAHAGQGMPPGWEEQINIWQQTLYNTIGSTQLVREVDTSRGLPPGLLTRFFIPAYYRDRLPPQHAWSPEWSRALLTTTLDYFDLFLSSPDQAQQAICTSIEQLIPEPLRYGKGAEQIAKEIFSFAFPIASWLDKGLLSDELPLSAYLPRSSHLGRTLRRYEQTNEPRSYPGYAAQGPSFQEAFGDFMQARYPLLEGAKPTKASLLEGKASYLSSDGWFTLPQMRLIHLYLLGANFLLFFFDLLTASFALLLSYIQPLYLGAEIGLALAYLALLLICLEIFIISLGEGELVSLLGSLWIGFDRWMMQYPCYYLDDLSVTSYLKHNLMLTLMLCVLVSALFFLVKWIVLAWLQHAKLKEELFSLYGPKKLPPPPPPREAIPSPPLPGEAGRAFLQRFYAAYPALQAVKPPGLALSLPEGLPPEVGRSGSPLASPPQEAREPPTPFFELQGEEKIFF